MAGVDDATLVELASERRRELLPALRRHGSLTPLVALLAILPGLYALANNALEPGEVEWGLASLKLLAAPTLERFLEAGGPVSQSPNWRSPLALWLTAAALSIPRLPPSIGIALVSFLSTAGTVGAWYFLCQRLAGARFAFWATLMLSLHGPFLAYVQTAGPTAPAILLAVCGMWGFFAHCDGPEHVVSGSLLLAGIALGLCVLTSGPLAIVVVAVLGLPAVVSRTAFAEASGGGRQRRLYPPRRWTALRSLAVLFVTALAVGGWWVLMMISRHGSAFWLVWSGLDEATTFRAAHRWETTRGLVSLAAVHMIDLTGVLLGPALFGLWRAARELWWAKDGSRPGFLAFLMIWLACALLMWWASLSELSAGNELGRLFLLLPMVGFAALAVEEIVERRVGALAAAWMVAAAILIPQWAGIFDSPGPEGLPRTVRETSAFTAWTLAGFALLSVWLMSFARHRDGRQRVCLIGLLLLIACTGARQGLRSVRLMDDERQSRRSLNEFSSSLASASGVAAQILITDSAAPPDVEFVMRAAQPRFALQTVRSLKQGIDLGAVETQGSKQAVLIVDWRAVDSPSISTTGGRLQLERLSPPLMLHGRRLVAYRLSGRDGAP